MNKIAGLAGVFGLLVTACATSGEVQQTAPTAAAPATVLAAIPMSPVPSNAGDPMLAPKSDPAPMVMAPLYVSKYDPSGAPMCFDGAGNKALLANCHQNPSHVMRLDPSGAPMCFTRDGSKARLDQCGVSSSYLSQLDPSGGRACFHRSGKKAPLAKCTGATSMTRVSGLLATAE